MGLHRIALPAVAAFLTLSTGTLASEMTFQYGWLRPFFGDLRLSPVDSILYRSPIYMWEHVEGALSATEGPENKHSELLPDGNYLVQGCMFHHCPDAKAAVVVTSERQPLAAALVNARCPRTTACKNVLIVFLKPGGDQTEIVELFRSWADLPRPLYERPEMTEIVMLPVVRPPPLPRIRP
jgi:hypothetical protein